MVQMIYVFFNYIERNGLSEQFGHGDLQAVPREDIRGVNADVQKHD